MNNGRKYSRLSNPATWLLLIAFLASFSTACKKPAPVIVPVGDAQIAGKVVAGVVTLEPGQDPKATYYLVDRKFILVTFSLAYQVKELTLELKKCQAEKGKK